MNETSKQLASRLVEVHHDIMDPVYQEIRQQLLGSLATSSLHLEEMREIRNERQTNMAILIQVRSLLPTTKDNEFEFNAPDQYVARAIQASTIWLYNQSEVPLPYYVIGDRPSLEYARHHELLLLPVSPKIEGVTTVVISNDRAKAVAEHNQDIIGRPFTQEELKSSYNLEKDTLEIESYTPGTIYELVYGRLFAPKTVKGIESKGLCVTVQNTGDQRYGVTDLEIEEFSVIETLSELAARFDVSEQLKLIFNQSTEDLQLPIESTGN
jgi:hypothetical protein